MEKNKVFVYLLIIFFAAFVGTGIFLVVNNKKTTINEQAASTSIIPTTEPTQGSLNLKLFGNEKISLLTGQELSIDLIADSNEKNIVGYDLVLSYDPSSFDFVKATSDLVDFKIYSYKKDSYLSLLATKILQSQTTSVFAQTKIASLVFKPLKAGKFIFSLKSLIGKDRTDLVTDKTEVLNPKLNELEIEVF
ncbi:MAG: hypothetical protein UV09_C0052G0003 [Candidatus Gottesmanbacteria bacterium GW2011_GWA2_42_18]|uniref:Cohesin domain-containing protein n=1 Tax=Candidatus Gottesmanbacteria bacterium GW2011_GWA2_42_18 TaxID=1618442 RepID=A0A0G0Z8A3_9BACT|nr:MAG: hypothetical protein UV09_C0052G0003 [Candidatus Gottesmanbacteria bacterium GW2011_GWA2_42_18]